MGVKNFMLWAFLCTTTVNAVRFDITNREGGPVWVGIQGNPGHEHLRNGGFVLNQGQTTSVNAPDNWAGRFWPRTWCDPNSKHCMTGDCGNRVECAGAGGVPPATLLEIKLKGDAGLDYYDISLVDGFNIRAFIEPVGGRGDGGRYNCKRAGCLADVNSQCPNDLRINHQGQTIACQSACNRFNNDHYCCRGQYNSPSACDSRRWPVNYPGYSKGKCPAAYSYAQRRFIHKAGQAAAWGPGSRRGPYFGHKENINMKMKQKSINKWPLKKGPLSLTSMPFIVYEAASKCLIFSSEYFQFHFDGIEIEAATLVDDATYKEDFSRTRKRKVFFDETKENEVHLSGKEKFKVEAHYVIYDSIIQDLERQIKSYQTVNERFKCFLAISMT
ncbi:pathogenesis-related protein 5-like isoform X2 [Sitophilus oryzae]|uniref:Pathogenesis-related protein 5-like isoform X1 n=1 Tax=Sitophilus oryzae TaxID=7048 RepID=A0A6J2XVC0_SITOR|nr:pathogenesis-related protein 5-like isoform X1 [Sitophilus oryzae]XP_030754554.1 pathogenesis-related protein 5-like isoform X2 [Sitophilus oryzae]